MDGRELVHGRCHRGRSRHFLATVIKLAADLKLNSLKLHEIIHDKDCYVYSTSYRFCISPFAFAPSTTVGPMNLDFSRAVNITWNRKDRNLLPSI